MHLYIHMYIFVIRNFEYICLLDNLLEKGYNVCSDSSYLTTNTIYLSKHHHLVVILRNYSRCSWIYLTVPRFHDCMKSSCGNDKKNDVVTVTSLRQYYCILKLEYNISMFMWHWHYLQIAKYYLSSYARRPLHIMSSSFYPITLPTTPGNLRFLKQQRSMYARFVSDKTRQELLSETILLCRNVLTRSMFVCLN